MQDNHQDARNWGMLCHLASLLWLPLAFLGLAIPFANVVGPLIVWLYKKGDEPFVNNHGKESLNFQISMTIYGLILFVVVAVFALIYLAVAGTAASTEQVAFLMLGGAVGLSLFGLFIVLGFVDLILVIVASLEAYNGKSYRYPLTIRFLR